MSRRPHFSNPVAMVWMLSTDAEWVQRQPGAGQRSSSQSINRGDYMISYPQGDFRSPLTFGNPYAHIPAQCHIETSRGTQNACLFCHTNGAYRAGLGNNFPQAGAEPRLGDLQLEYSFTSLQPLHAFAGAANPGKIPDPGKVAGNGHGA
ncbi:MAG: hypothetical protein R3F36_14430 [Candidatus Competibacteraceae bacterium]